MTILTAFLVVLAVGLVSLGILHAVRNATARREKRARFIAGYRFPATLDRRLAARHPQLDARQRERVREGLRQYFLACLAARAGGVATQVGMPSRVVDDAWHEFILLTRDYERFCREAFGATLHHTPKEASPVPIRDALANTAHQFGKSPFPGTAWAMAGGIPLLFALDRELGIADGYPHDDGTVEALRTHARSLAATSGGDVSFSFDGSGGDGDGGGDGGGCGGGCSD